MLLGTMLVEAQLFPRSAPASRRPSRVRRFARVVEACVHLGVWQHFDRYVPVVVQALEENMRAELAATHALPAASDLVAMQGFLAAEGAGSP
jgi:hypothetical protein